MDDVTLITNHHLDKLREQFSRYRYHVAFTSTDPCMKDGRLFGFVCGLLTSGGALHATNHIFCLEYEGEKWVCHHGYLTNWIKIVGPTLLIEQLREDLTQLEMNHVYDEDSKESIAACRLAAFLRSWNITAETEEQKVWKEVLLVAWKHITGQKGV